ncbi:hypothetical protein GCM10009547_38830 [Sporichthya brevicatena]|uniref:Uncharacterized protein n=1 Tax=Sporichthya brevicatena TaxID=171442 RepID=A0ABN1H798_9ACTN
MANDADEHGKSNALYQDNRTAPIVKKEPKAAVISARQLAPGTYQPRWYEDIPWRISYRIKRGVFTIWGPPQLNPHNDPLALLARRREERYAGRNR